MEVALALQDKSQLTFLEEELNNMTLLESEQSIFSMIKDQVNVSTGSITRLYFGSEFCQYRITPLEDVQAAYELSKEKGYHFTYVTPYVPETGLNKLRPILTWLHDQEDADAIEVVVNDWGICFAIARKFPKLQISVGRLLNKMIRDPRVAHLYDEEEAPKRAKSVFMNTSLDTPYFTQFLRRMNVQRIELDSFIQPVEKAQDSYGVPASLYIGYGVIATGRSCLVGTLHKPSEEKFLGDIQCKQQCMHYVAKMDNTREQLGQLPVNTLQKGNTAFYEQTETLLKEGLEEAQNMGVNRLIISPKIPV